MNSTRIAATLVFCLFTGLSIAGATDISQAFRIDFATGFLDGQQFNGQIKYNDRDLTGIGAEFLYTNDDFYDDSWSKQPNQHVGFGSFGVTIADIRFTLRSTRSDWFGRSYLRFEDGSMTQLKYTGLVEKWPDDQGRADWVRDVSGLGYLSTWFMRGDGVSITQSWGTTILISDDEGPASRLANQLGEYGISDWHSIKKRLSFATPYADFVRVDDFDDSLLRPTEGARILLESIFGDSEMQNTFGIIEEIGGFQTLLTNRRLLDGVTINASAIEADELGFAVDQGDGTSRIVPLSDSRRVRTYVSTNTDPGFILWMLDDNIDGGDSVNRDFNDFILLATLKAVPEPAVAITLLSVVLILTAFQLGSRRTAGINSR